MGCSFIGGGVSVLAYRFFYAVPKNHIPVVGDYGLPVRTYVAPQEEKNLQKIYDLDQEESPIVEKILPYSDVPEPSAVKDCSEKDSKFPSQNVKPGVPTDGDLLKTPPLSSKEFLNQTPKLSKPSSPKGSLPKTVSKNVDSGLEKSTSGVAVLPCKKVEPESNLRQRPQIGPVFSDLNRVKEFLVRLKAKAEGYDFKIQSRSVKGKMVYRIITQQALDSEEVKKILHLAHSLRSASP